MDNKKAEILVVIPAYNEEKSIGKVVSTLSNQIRELAQKQALLRNRIDELNGKREDDSES